MESTLRFDSARRAEVEMTALSLSVARIATTGWTPRLSLGLVLDGELRRNDGPRSDVGSGALLALGVERRVRDGSGGRPSLDLSGSFSATWTSTGSPGSDATTSYFATDVRLGARAGWRLGSRVFPYTAIRVFGGPVQWEWDGADVQGSDIHHYQLGAGVAVQAGRLAFHAEWAPAGEKGLGAGLSTAW